MERMWGDEWPVACGNQSVYFLHTNNTSQHSHNHGNIQLHTRLKHCYIYIHCLGDFIAINGYPGTHVIEFTSSVTLWMLSKEVCI